MKKYLGIIAFFSTCFYMISAYTATPTCKLEIVNDGNKTIWVVPTPGNSMVRESGSYFLREGQNRFKIAPSQSWTYTLKTFYIYEQRQNDAYALTYKVMVHDCPATISYSSIKQGTFNSNNISIKNLSGPQPRQRR